MTDEHEKSETDEASAERRSRANPKERERRFIKRLSEPQLRRNIQQAVTFSRLILAFAAVYACIIFGTAFSKDVLGRTRSFFVIVATLLFAIGLWFFERAAVSYLSNESIDRLVIALEKLRNFFLVILVLVYVFGTVHIVSLF